jgi:excisionase family DNA binding protein
MEKMYTINEVARDLHIARRTVHDWIAKGELKAFHLGGKRLTRIWEHDLLAFVQRGSHEPKKGGHQ